MKKVPIMGRVISQQSHVKNSSERTERWAIIYNRHPPTSQALPARPVARRGPDKMVMMRVVSRWVIEM